jgi:hypothetical protein
LAIISFLLAAVGSAVVHRDFRQLIQYWALLGASAPLLIFGVLNWLFNNYLWRIEIYRNTLNLFGFPVPPYLGGEYEVCFNWHDPNPQSGESKNGESFATLTVVQTWRKISLSFVFRDTSISMPRADARSIMASLECTADPKRVLLEYTYDFQGIKQQPEGGFLRSRRHGASHAVFIRSNKNGLESWIVYGDYYSDDGISGTYSICDQ